MGTQVDCKCCSQEKKLGRKKHRSKDDQIQLQTLVCQHLFTKVFKAVADQVNCFELCSLCEDKSINYDLKFKEALKPDYLFFKEALSEIKEKVRDHENSSPSSVNRKIGHDSDTKTYRVRTSNSNVKLLVDTLLILDRLICTAKRAECYGLIGFSDVNRYEQEFTNRFLQHLKFIRSTLDFVQTQALKRSVK